MIVLLIFGPGKLPELGKSLGEGLKELKKATSPEDPAASKTDVKNSVFIPTPIAAATTCPSCQGSVPAGDKFCGNCGAQIGEPAKAVS